MNIIVLFFAFFIIYIITVFAFSNILGIVLYKLPKKEYNTILGLVFWSVLEIAVCFFVTMVIPQYFKAFVIASIIGILSVISNLNQLREES